MVHYHELPKDTSQATRLSVLLMGICLGAGIGISALIGICGLTGFLASYFYAGSFAIAPHEAIYDGLLGVVALLTTGVIGVLAFNMNRLYKRSINLSRIAWLPTLLVALMAIWQRQQASFSYHLSWGWVVASIISFVAAGLLPILFMSSPAVRRLHSRPNPEF